MEMARYLHRTVQTAKQQSGKSMRMLDTMDQKLVAMKLIHPTVQSSNLGCITTMKLNARKESKR